MDRILFCNETSYKSTLPILAPMATLRGSNGEVENLQKRDVPVIVAARVASRRRNILRDVSDKDSTLESVGSKVAWRDDDEEPDDEE